MEAIDFLERMDPVDQVEVEVVIAILLVGMTAQAAGHPTLNLQRQAKKTIQGTHFTSRFG